MKRTISILAALCLLLTMLPLSAWAKTADTTKDWEIPAQVNPLYAHVLDRETVAAQLAAVPGAEEPCGSEYVSETEAIQQIRDRMKLRTDSFIIRVRTTNESLGDLIWDMFYSALDHTGVPDEGDYLAWQYGGWGVQEVTAYESGGKYYMDVYYVVIYYNDAAQEAQMDTAVDNLLDQLDLDGLSDYEKVCGIYDYITNNIEYDYDHLYDPDYMLMYTAYAALVNGTAVCQGYANLFYRLALELGVDSRIVVGWAGGPHAWNIVELDEMYYYLDSTWDATYAQYGWDYEYFLRGSSNFQDHVPDTVESAFVSDYPISRTDYDPANPGKPDDPEEPEEPVIPETDFLECEWEVLMRTNRERHLEGLEPLTTQELLFEAADIRAWEITDFFSHARPNGTSFATVLDDVAYPWAVAGENIAAGQWLAGEVVDDWMNSQDHRENILYEGFVHLGVGYEMTSDIYGNYWTQLFTAGLDCRYTSLELNAEALEVEKGTQLEELGLWATAHCAGCGDCYLPILPEYCEGYDPDRSGVQTVTVSCLGETATLTITVVGAENGDANGDGKVNGLDVILLRQYIAGWDVTVDPIGGDANGDGKVNGLDVILLRQYIAGWDVTLGPKE